MFNPWLPGDTGMFHTGDASTKIRRCNDVDVTVTMNIQRQIGEVLVVMRIGARQNLTHYVSCPLRRFVPRVSTEDIQPAIAVEISCTGGFKRKLVANCVLPPARLVRIFTGRGKRRCQKEYEAGPQGNETASKV